MAEGRTPPAREYVPRLIVGGGRASATEITDDLGTYMREGFPSHRRQDVTLNIDPAAEPDVLGDIRNPPDELPARGFREVFFERVPFMMFTDENIAAIKQSARLLRWGGRLIIETGSGISTQQLTQVSKVMKEHGFRYVRVTARTRGGGIRISRRQQREET